MGHGFFYQIGAFGPPAQGGGVSYWNVRFELDPSFAADARRSKMTDGLHRILQQDAKYLFHSLGLNELGEVENPYHFVEDSLLINSILVPGDSADVSLDESGREWFIEDWERMKGSSESLPIINYVPHNIMDIRQAASMVSLWTYWTYMANSVLRKS